MVGYDSVYLANYSALFNYYIHFLLKTLDLMKLL